MKKIVCVALMLFCACGLMLFGCGNSGLRNNPNTNASVLSNGGMAVEKGDYVYFVNGFASSTDLKKGDNKWGEVEKGAIYRTKLNDNGNLEKDKDGFLKNADVVVPKLVGFENGGFYIFGDYIYYTTPNMQVDKSGVLLNTLTDFCRVNINGTDNKVLYTSLATITKDNYSMNYVNGNVYITLFDNNNLVQVKANGNSSVKTINKAVSSVGLMQLDKLYLGNENTAEFNGTVINGYNNYVYYTRSAVEDDKLGSISGNLLCRVKIGEYKEEILNPTDLYNVTYNIVDFKNNSLYYTTTKTNGSNIAILKKNTIGSNGDFSILKEETVVDAPYDKYYVLDSISSDNSGTEVLVYSNNTLMLKSNNGKNTKNVLSATISIISVNGSKVLYSQDGVYKIIDVLASDTAASIITLDIQEKTIKTDVSVYADFNGTQVYLYAKYVSAKDVENYYLNRLNLNATEPKLEFVGVFKSGDTPEKPEDEEQVWIK